MDIKTNANKSFLLRFRLRNDGYLLLDNLTTLLLSGMDIVTGLQSIKEETSAKEMKKSLGQIITEIDNGSPFWRAIKHSNIFSDRIVSLIRIGEETGKLPENLEMISLQQRKEQEFKAKLQTALVYPSIVVSLIFVIGSIVSLFILPRLAEVFTSLHIALPITTRIMVAIGSFLGTYGFIVVPLFLLTLASVIYILFLNSKTKIVGETLLLRTPKVRTVIQQIELSRFGYLLGNILETGLPLTTAIDSLSEATTFISYKHYYEKLHTYVEEGNSFNKSFRAMKETATLFPPSIQQMISVAEQSGRLPETLKKIGETYEKKVDTASQNMTVALEPILLIIIGIGVFFLAISVILPIYGLISNLSSLGQ